MAARDIVKQLKTMCSNGSLIPTLIVLSLHGCSACTANQLMIDTLKKDISTFHYIDIPNVLSKDVVNGIKGFKHPFFKHLTKKLQNQTAFPFLMLYAPGEEISSKLTHEGTMQSPASLCRFWAAGTPLSRECDKYQSKTVESLKTH